MRILFNPLAKTDRHLSLLVGFCIAGYLNCIPAMAITVEPDLTPSESVTDVIGKKYWGSYSDYHNAKQRANSLQSQGHDARVETLTPAMQVRSLRIHGYLFRDDAEVVARHLQSQGIDAVITTDDKGLIYEVQAGTFSTQDKLDRRQEKLEFLGYKKIRETQTWIKVKKYNVISLIHPVIEKPQDDFIEGLPTDSDEILITEQADDESIILLDDSSASNDEDSIILLDDTADSSDEEIILLGGSEDESVILFDGEETLLSELDETITYSSPTTDIVDTGYDVVDRQRFELRFDEILIEAGLLTHDLLGFDTADYARAKFFFLASPFNNWDLYLQARVDKNLQNVHDTYQEMEGELGEAYVRYRGEQSRLTIGNQLVLWGRLDGEAPTDKLSARDVTRLLEDDVANRRRPSPTVRYEQFMDDYKLDFVMQPFFRSAEMPDFNSIWSPVDKRLGRLIGIEPDPTLAPLIQGGRFDDHDDDGFMGNVGLRISHTGEGMDYAATIQTFKQSAPAYSVNSAVLADLQRQVFFTGTSNIALAEANVGSASFTAKHPRSWLVGGDVSLVKDIGILRFEAALQSDQPVLPEGQLQIDTVPSLEWGAGWEFYPGDANARFILQLGGRFLLSNQDLVENKQTLFFNGQLENTFSEEKWRARLNFNIAMHERDIFLNPEIAYVGFQSSEVYLGYLFFNGEDDSFAGFYDRNNMAVGGWRIRY